MNYLTCNVYDAKGKNKWKSQQIQKKYKNRHQYRYSDIDKNLYKKQNRIQIKKTSRVIDYNIKTKSMKKQKNISTKNYYKITVDISLRNPDNKIINLPDSEYKIIQYQLENATINIVDTKQKISYLSYSFIPCNTYYSRYNNNILYQKQNDLFIPLFFDKYNKIKYNLIDIFNNNKFININKPFISIAQKCLDVKTSSNRNNCYSHPYDWTISNIKTNSNIVCVTVSTTVITNNDIDSKYFIKSRPYTKKDINSLYIVDPLYKKQLICNLSNNTYVNAPILLNKNNYSIESLAMDENNQKISVIYDKFQEIMCSISEEKMDIIETKQSENIESPKYWFCVSCFVMNTITSTISVYKCFNCNKQTIDKSLQIYYKEYLSICKPINIALTKTETKALNYVKNYSQKAARISKHSLLKKVKTQTIYDKLLYFMANTVPLIIHIKSQELISKLLKDTHYRNLFEVGKGNGCTNKDTRTMHENIMFPNIYKPAKPKEKPKYGCLNIGMKSDGCNRAIQYGKAYFTLNNDTVRWRVSYTNTDSFSAKGKLGTLGNCQHLLDVLSDCELTELIDTAIYNKKGGINQRTYREIQIHGPLLLNRDIQSLHVPKNEKHYSKIYQEFARKNSCKLIWF